MAMEIAAGLALGVLVLLFLTLTAVGRTAFKAGFGFFVGSAMVLSAAGTVASAVLVLLLLEPSIEPILEWMAPWYALITVGTAVFAGFVGAVRAVRLR
ncbi:MAG: hypothetical protein R3223_11025 [Longimicrobiales bacterium]|nr:hypothetical protein [Longimicrobiales bacterium]